MATKREASVLSISKERRKWNKYYTWLWLLYVGYATHDLAFSSQLGVLAIGEICVGAAGRPLLEAVLEAGGILEIAARGEGAELRLSGEVDVTGAGADGGFAVGLDEVYDPVVEQLKVHQDAGHGRSVRRRGVAFSI
jgi:hypothetical protein